MKSNLVRLGIDAFSIMELTGIANVRRRRSEFTRLREGLLTAFRVRGSLIQRDLLEIVSRRNEEKRITYHGNERGARIDHFRLTNVTADDGFLLHQLSPKALFERTRQIDGSRRVFPSPLPLILINHRIPGLVTIDDGDDLVFVVATKARNEPFSVRLSDYVLLFLSLCPYGAAGWEMSSEIA